MLWVDGGGHSIQVILTETAMEQHNPSMCYVIFESAADC